MGKAKLSKKNQMVLPKEAREELNVGPGDTLHVHAAGGKVVLTKDVERQMRILDELCGSSQGAFGDPVAFVRKERETWRKRERQG